MNLHRDNYYGKTNKDSKYKRTTSSSGDSNSSNLDSFAIDKFSKISSKSWNRFKKRIWILIYNYLKKDYGAKLPFNYRDLQTEIINFLYTFDDFHSLLSQDSEKLISIKRAIIAIYLFMSDNPPSQTEIRKISGFTGNYQLKQIRDCLNIPLPPSIANRNLFNDPIARFKECSSCHEIKSYNDFFFRDHLEGSLRAECRSCHQKVGNKRLHEKKLLLCIFLILKNKSNITVEKYLRDIKQGKIFDKRIGCVSCGSDITEMLPVIDFHHKDSNKKTGTFGREFRSLALYKLIQIAEKEDIEILCVNCHRLKEASIFRKYFNIISRARSCNEIMILRESKRVREAILTSVIKKLVIEELFNGVCSNCQKVGIEMLPALSFHHSVPSLKSISPTAYININSRNIDKIKRKFIEEKIIVLCENCHRLEEATAYRTYCIEIAKKYLKLFSELNTHYNHSTKYNRTARRIVNFFCFFQFRGTIRVNLKNRFTLLYPGTLFLKNLYS